MPLSPIPIPSFGEEHEFVVKADAGDRYFEFYCNSNQVLHLFRKPWGRCYGLFIPAGVGTADDPRMVAWIKALFDGASYSSVRNDFQFSDNDFVLLKLMAE